MGTGRREAPIAVGAGGAKGRRGQLGAIEGQLSDFFRCCPKT